jgi:CubicO group peptidase (beta-lactamase class C family)
VIGRHWRPSPRLGELVDRAEAPVGIAVIDGYEVVWHTVAGGSSATLFQAGSIAKSATALLALDLVAAGLLSLDGRVDDQLVSWRADAPVTLRQLLSHTSGANVAFFPGYGQDEPVPSPLDVLTGTAPSVTPAVQIDPAAIGQFRYSGGGYLIVQQLVADVIGEPFPDVAHARVLGPLGMDHSTFAQPLAYELRPAAARPDWRIYPETAAAGLWTTAEDLARMACAIQRAAAGQPSPVTADTATAMLTPHVSLPPDGEWAILASMGMQVPDQFGLGLFHNGGERFGHIGGAASFFSALTGSTRNGSGAVVMTATNPTPYLFDILLAIDEQQGWHGFRATS